MKKSLVILLCMPLIGFGQWQLPAEFTAQSDPVNIMPISFTTDSTAVMSLPAGGDTLIVHNWSWDFGDGTTDSVQNPIHTYSGYSTFIVCLTVWAIPTNGNLIQYTFINCDTFTYSPSGWARIGQTTPIYEVECWENDKDRNNKIFDIIGREHKSIITIPSGSIYIRGGRRYLKE
jgi:hypothetical protein